MCEQQGDRDERTVEERAANEQGIDSRDTDSPIADEEKKDERQELIERRARELEKSFSYDGYQVVRKELFAHLRDPAVVIRRDSVTFNTACINGLEDTVYIQIMINIPEKKMAVRRCGENDKGALRWCIEKPDKRRSRKMSSRPFAAKLYKDMGWSTDCRYKIMGYRITSMGQTLYVFDLSETEVFLDTRSPGKRKKKVPKEETVSSSPAAVSEPMRTEGKETETDQDAVAEQNTAEQNTIDQSADGQAGAVQPQQVPIERRTRKRGHFPKEWENSYGLPVMEHDSYKQINLKEGFVSVSSDQQKEAVPDGR